MTDLAAAFADYQALRGYSPHTIRRRACTLRSLAKLTHPAPIESASADVLSELIAEASNMRTRHARLTDLRAFYRWAVRRSLVDTDPTALLDPIHLPKSLPRPIERPDRVTHARDADTALMVALGLYAGLRRSEIAALHSDDVHGTYLVVRGGKGGKDRTVPLHPELVRMLSGRTGRLFTVSPDTISRRIKQHLASCGITATAHQLRHTFGTELARTSSGDLLMIGALMGHANVATTMGYTQLGGDLGQSAVARMFTKALPGLSNGGTQ